MIIQLIRKSHYFFKLSNENRQTEEKTKNKKKTDSTTTINTDTDTDTHTQTPSNMEITLASCLVPKLEHLHDT